MKRKKPKKIKSIKPNRGVELAYRKKMQTLISEMQVDIEKEISSLYKKQQAAMAMDAPGKRESFAQCLSRLRERWYSRYDKAANDMARWFAESTEKRSSYAIRRKLKEAGLTVEIVMTSKIKVVMQKAIEENAKLIKSIPRKYLKRVQEAAKKSFEKGRDLATFKNELKQIGDITDKRASLIARDQTDKNTQNFALVQAKEVGATQGRWLHVPGVFSSRKSHKAMNGKVFDLDKGCWDEHEQKYVKPGELPNCACQFEVIIPGFE